LGSRAHHALPGAHGDRDARRTGRLAAPAPRAVAAQARAHRSLARCIGARLRSVRPAREPVRPRRRSACAGHGGRAPHPLRAGEAPSAEPSGCRMRSRARIGFACAAAGALVAAALGAGVLDGLPAPGRVGLGFCAIVLLPGLGWSLAIGVRPPGGRVLALGWALGYGVAWAGLAVLATRALGIPFTLLARFGAPWAALPWLAAIAIGPR